MREKRRRSWVRERNEGERNEGERKAVRGRAVRGRAGSNRKREPVGREGERGEIEGERY